MVAKLLCNNQHSFGLVKSQTGLHEWQTAFQTT